MPVDVGHVDIRDDEIEIFPRQETKRFEVALRFHDLRGLFQFLEAGSQEGSHCRRVFYDQDALQSRLPEAGLSAD